MININEKKYDVDSKKWAVSYENDDLHLSSTIYLSLPQNATDSDVEMAFNAQLNK